MLSSQISDSTIALNKFQLTKKRVENKLKGAKRGMD